MILPAQMLSESGLPKGLILWDNPIQYWVDPDTGQPYKREWKDCAWTDFEPADKDDIELILKKHMLGEKGG